MRTEFERKEVWDLMRKRIMASPYTRPGDPLKIDCGYKPNGFLHMFHAVSLESDLDTAKVLAFSFAGLREGIRRVEKADLELTAIVEPLGAWKSADGEPDSERRAQYDFGWKTMESHEIRVLTTTALPGIAATARRELLGLID